MSDISQRKTDHLDLAARGDVGFRGTTTLLECVRLIHDALPECKVDEIDCSVDVLGKKLRAPLLIAAMTGGNPRAKEINRQLARIADERGYAFGLGSQRAMLPRNGKLDPSAIDSFKVRDVAPNVLLLGNLGVVQARQMSTAEVEDLVQSVGADALCVHLNPAMELIQSDGDRDFRGGLETLGRLAADLSIPVIAKETGCGLSASVARRLSEAGIRHVDVSGAGGTSWVGVETRRADDSGRALGEVLWDWGIPTAASVAQVASAGMETIFATGGVKNGLDVARALALGATAGGIARPVLQAVDAGGPEGAAEFLDRVEAQVRAVLLLTGSRKIEDLRAAPRVITGELQSWIA